MGILPTGKSRARSSSTFSITQFLTDLAGSDPHAQVEYVPFLGREMLYTHQISLFARSQPHAPYALEPRSLFVSGICNSDTVSRKVFMRLTDAGILDEHGMVHVARLDGKKFAHQIRVLALRRQKDLAELLFWWEEECMRLRKLIESEAELGRTIKAVEAELNDVEHHDRDQAVQLDLERLRFEREKARMRIRQRPSERRDDIESERDTLFEESQRLVTRLDLDRRAGEQIDGGVVGRRRTEPGLRTPADRLPGYWA